jgi:hypothetical protein
MQFTVIVLTPFVVPKPVPGDFLGGILGIIFSITV